MCLSCLCLPVKDLWPLELQKEVGSEVLAPCILLHHPSYSWDKVQPATLPLRPGPTIKINTSGLSHSSNDQDQLFWTLTPNSHVANVTRVTSFLLTAE